MSLKQMVKNAKNPDLIVLPKLDEYLATVGEVTDFKPDTLEKLFKVMGTKQRDRTKSFSASAAGMCKRRQVMGFIGVPVEADLNPRLKLIFAQGNFIHLMLQGIMLDSGIITDIEFPATWHQKLHRGTLDGIGHVHWKHDKYHNEDFIVEIKGRNSWAFQSSQRNNTPEYSYKKQSAKYMILTGIDLVSIVYMNKDTQDMAEWVYHRDDIKVWVREAENEIEQLYEAASKKKLPKRLDGMLSGVEPECKGCPFSGKDGPCANVDTWKEAAAWQSR